MQDSTAGVDLAYRIVGTAGHIDHGKSTLVRALTGTDPDRLQEEKERGITIDLGFAHAAFGGFEIGFVDVPGHERFVKNMLAGVGGIDLVLLVIAADESVMPQTREHLAICELLGVRAGVVALSKCDLVDEEIAELAELEVTELLEGTALADASIVHTSAGTGAGLEPLRNALAEALRSLPPRAGAAVSRLPIDRVFSVRGFGTVVTGTLIAGAFETGSRLDLLPRERQVTVRGLQVHGAAAERAVAGQRVALNLHGVGTDEVSRGMVLAPPGTLRAAQVFDVRLQALPGHAVQHLQRVRFHHGAAELLARVALLQGDEVAAGESACCQLRLEAPYPVVPGDRVVLRRYSPLVTIAGAEILDGHAPKRRRGAHALDIVRGLAAASDGERLRHWIRTSGNAGIDEQQLRQRCGRAPEAFAELMADLANDVEFVRVEESPARLLARRVVTAAGTRILDGLAKYHGAHPLRPGMERGALRAVLASPTHRDSDATRRTSAGAPDPSSPAAPGRTTRRELSDAVLEAVLETLAAEGRITIQGSHVALTEHRVRLDDDESAAYDSLLGTFTSAGLAPPPADEILDLQPRPTLARELFHLALRDGELTRIDSRYVVAPEALERLVEDLKRRVPGGERFSIAQFKEWTGLSRKHSIPLLEYLDGVRVTRRSGDDRLLT